MITTEPPAGVSIHGSLPQVASPPAGRERRGTFRRGEDRAIHADRPLLARSLDILAGPGDAVEQLAGILLLVARSVGARHAALLVEDPVRHVTVAIGADEPG